MKFSLRLLSVCVATMLVCCVAAADQSPKDWGNGVPYSYIVWDGHRFSSTPEEHERDTRYFKDLGFTHSLVDAAPGAMNPKQVDSRRAMLAMFQKYGLIAGIKYGWRFEGLTQPWNEMTAAGMTLRATGNSKEASAGPAFNPLHPAVIESYASSILESFQAHRALDPGQQIKLFLIGSEYGFQLPDQQKCPPAAAELILQAARADGALGPREDDWTKVKSWWTGPTSHGGDWRIRKRIADDVHKIAPDAMFMIDPIWCVKLVEGGFGGHWSYIGKGMPLGMPDDAIRTMAQSWPFPATHSTQLINGAHHDTILEGNLLCMCIGLPSLYHWGVHTIEPGHFANPYYRYKGARSAEVEAGLRQELMVNRLDKEPALRSTGRFIRERGQMLHDWQPLQPRVAYLAGIYGPADPHLAMMVGQIPFDLLRNREHRDAELAKYKYVLVGKGKGPLELSDYDKLLQVEKAGGSVILPKGFALPEGAQPLAKALEWDPELVGESIGAKKGISFAGGYAGLQEHTKAGATHLREVLGRAGFKPYFDIASREVVSRPYQYQGHKMLFVVNDKRVVGDRPTKEQPELSEPDANGVVAPLRPEKKKADAGPPAANVGVPAEIEVLIRDSTAGLTVVDIDTGRVIKPEPCDAGHKFKDTVPGAWYRIYAVAQPGQKYQGPPPLAKAPGVNQVTAARASDGIQLQWKTDVPDWLGCEVQWYRIYRGEANVSPQLVKEIYGRTVDGGGGLVESYLDREAAPGRAYKYQVQAVSPLRIEGSMSSPVLAR